MADAPLRRTLRQPGAELKRFDRSGPTLRSLPLGAWSRLFAIALLGSGLYGASVGLAMPGWRVRGTALWMALAAGSSWFALVPSLAWLTRRRFWTCLQACFVTIAYGEAVLVGGAVANTLQRLSGRRVIRPAALNVGIVGLSNVVMAASLAHQLRCLGVPVWKVLLVWFGVLDGVGAALFWLTRGLRRGG